MFVYNQFSLSEPNTHVSFCDYNQSLSVFTNCRKCILLANNFCGTTTGSWWFFFPNKKQALWSKNLYIFIYYYEYQFASCIGIKCYLKFNEGILKHFDNIILFFANILGNMPNHSFNVKGGGYFFVRSQNMFFFCFPVQWSRDIVFTTKTIFLKHKVLSEFFVCPCQR